MLLSAFSQRSKSVTVQNIENDLTDLTMTFRNESSDASEWRDETEGRLDEIDAILVQTTTQPDVEPTQPPTDCPSV